MAPSVEQTRQGRRNRRHGADAERRTKAYLEERGMVVVRAAKGTACDLIAWNNNIVVAVEVKATAVKPTPSTYKPFVEMPRGRLDGKWLMWWKPHAREPKRWDVDD